MTTLKTYLANTLTAGAVALVAITAGPAPATAGDKDLLRALAGIAAAAVFVGAIQQNQNRNQTTRANRQYQFAPVEPRYQSADRGWDADRDWQSQNGAPTYRDERGGPRLPATCALEFGSGPRPATYYAESCLKREGVAYALPQYCAQQIRSRDYQGRVFEAECLQDAGYRIERWR